MLPNAFIGKPQPTEADLATALGPVKLLWDRLLSDLGDEFALTTREWNSYSRKAGWSLRLSHKKRNIVYLSPCRASFRASFALGDTAIAAARQSKLPPSVVKILDEAKRFAEGTAVRLHVEARKDLATVKTLVKVKLDN